MTTQDLLNKINASIKQNGNGEITGEILNEILQDLLIYLDDKIGDLDTLNQTIKVDDLVSVANILQTQIESNKTGIHIGSGNPNDNPPESYATLDYYLQTDQNGDVLYLWQYTEKEWCKITNYIDDNAVSTFSTWSSSKIQNYIDELQARIDGLQKDIENLGDNERG